MANFYNDNPDLSFHLSHPLMKKVAQGGVRLTEKDKTDLKAFLLSLSDNAFVIDPNFKD